MKIHICLVSAQLLPNYISACMDKPDAVYLISTDKMRKTLAPRLADMLQEKGTQVILPEENIADSGLSRIQAYASDLLRRIQHTHPQSQLVLNATGGNKLMAFGMIEVFRPHASIIYTDTDNGIIEYFGRDTNDTISYQLSVPEYLKAYGVLYQHAASDDADWIKQVEKRHKSSRLLADVAQDVRSEPLITALNALAVQALDPKGQALVTPEQFFKWKPQGYWRKHLRAWSDAGLFTWDGETKIEFTTFEHTRYMAGIWLEEFAWLVARNVGVHDVRCSIDIRWAVSEGTLNELDVLLTHNNKMLVIECKTLRLQRGDSKPNDILYKIDSIAESIKGLFGRAVLLSALPPTKFMYERAKTQRIDILRPNELSAYLTKWMQS